MMLLFVVSKVKRNFSRTHTLFWQDLSDVPERGYITLDSFSSTYVTVSYSGLMKVIRLLK